MRLLRVILPTPFCARDAPYRAWLKFARCYRMPEVWVINPNRPQGG